MAVESDHRRIDVWWLEDDSSMLCLLFAYLMTRTELWDEAAIRLLVPTAGDHVKKVEDNLTYRLNEMRIEATIETVVDANAGAVAERSKDAAIVFLPLRLEGMRVLDPFGKAAEALVTELPVVAMVAAAQDIQLAEDEEEDVEHHTDSNQQGSR